MKCNSSLACRAGYSLAELTIALPAMTLLVAGLCSTIYLAARTVPQPDSLLSITLEAAAAIERLERDLRFAIAIEEMSEHEIEFTVPDRTGDLVPEIIRYSWSGTPGDPLVRNINDGLDEVLCHQVQGFLLAYETVLATTTEGETPVTSNHLQMVNVQLRTQGSRPAKMHTTIRVLNQPEVDEP